MEIIVDNILFRSREFLKFVNDWKFEVNTASPHYPQINGLAEKKSMHTFTRQETGEHHSLLIRQGSLGIG